MKEPATAERITVGAFEVLAFLDATIDLPLARVFPDTPASAWAPYRARDWFSETWSIPVRCFVVRDGKRTVLVDTGLGESESIAAQWRTRPGRLRADLEGAGIRVEDVDLVVLTHWHVDHVAGAVGPDSRALVFPRAPHLAHAADLEHVRAISGQFTREPRLTLLERLGALDLVDGDRDLSDGVAVVHTPGHTPGHLSVLVRSRDEAVLLSGDALHHPVHVSEPAWRDANDADHAQAVATRVCLLEWAERERLTLAPSHFHAPFGTVARLEGRREWRTLP